MMTPPRLGPAWALAGALLLLAGPARADSFLSFSAKAEKAERRKDSEAALQAWSNALHLWKPADGKAKKAHALSARAALREANGDWESAAKDLSAALKLDPKNALMFHQRGRLYLEHGKAFESVSDFYEATKYKPTFAEAFFDRARAYDIQGDAKFAREDYRTACHLGFKKACAGAAAAKAAAPKPAKKKAAAAGTEAPSAPAEAPATKETPAPEKTSPPAPPAEVAPAAPEPPAAAAPRRATKVSAPPAEKPLAPAAAIEEIPAQEGPAAPDFQACIGRVRACAESGESFGACVDRARACEDNPSLGCCPKECLEMFQRLSNSKSEAAAFREVFTPNSPCFTKEEL